MNAKLIGIIVLLIFLLILGIQNYQPLTLRFLFWVFETSVVLVLMVSFLVGALAGGLLFWVWHGKKKSPSPLTAEKNKP